MTEQRRVYEEEARYPSDRIERETVSEETRPISTGDLTPPTVEARRRTTSSYAADSYAVDRYGRERTTFAVAKTSQVLWWLLGIVEMLLGLRVILRLIAANEASPFVDFIYALTYPLVWPFIGVVGAPGIQGGPVFEAFTLIAMLVYLLATIAIVSLLRLIISDPVGDRYR